MYKIEVEIPDDVTVVDIQKALMFAYNETMRHSIHKNKTDRLTDLGKFIDSMDQVVKSD